MSFPFQEVGLSVLQHAPQVVFNPALGLRFAFYWAMVFFVFSQYRRTARLQGQLFGRARGDPVRYTALAAFEGLVVGIIGSYLMTFVGVSFLPDGGGLIWVLGAALLLMLADARLMCFSYAGGLVSLSYLVLGFPKVDVASLMALVAVLHLMESLLILINGAAGATPVYVDRKGRPVGAFFLQRSWPVPVAILILAVVSPIQIPGGIEMPEWWPLLRTSPEILAHPGAVFFLHALPAALGYSEVAVTCHPQIKVRRTALLLASYSLVLLGLSVAATYAGPLVWVTALFGPLGHEAVTRWGSRREMAGRPYFVPPEAGVMILDVVPGSPARQAGLGPGWILTEVNGKPVSGRDELEEGLRLAGEAGTLSLEVRPPEPGFTGGRGRGLTGGPRRLSFSFEPGQTLGVIPVPEPGDDMGLVISTGRPARSLLRRLFGRPGAG